MSYSDDIVDRARTYLTSGWSSLKTVARSSIKAPPELVFDHAFRVLETMKLLVKDPEISGYPMDPAVLAACAMFHDAGWVELVNSGQIHPAEVLTRPADTELLKRSSQIASDQIGKLLSANALKRVTQAITELKRPRPSLPETRVLADADNLDDFGLLGITFQIRSAHSQGKSVRQVVESWDRQQEYNYWEARIKSALHLEMSRKIARRRLEKMGRVFDLLRQETALEDMDIDEVLPQAAVINPPTVVSG